MARAYARWYRRALVQTEAMFRRTSLYQKHLGLGARMVPFAGWSMPVSYSGIVAEHRAVRGDAGLFDVSHMGELDCVGTGAGDLISEFTCVDRLRLGVGRARYSLVLTEAGGVMDDVIVYRLGADRYRVVMNAVNREACAEHARQIASGRRNVEVHDVSAEIGLLAIQGPGAEAVMQPLCAHDLAAVARFEVRQTEVAGLTIELARTGYTGEDGFELFVAARDAPRLWDALTGGGTDRGVLPAGLGARDTLRQEAALPLYGHELSRDISPLEIGLGRFVATTNTYVGADAIRSQRGKGVARRLVHLEVAGRVIAREGCLMTTLDGSEIGTVTSGTYGPWVERSLAMGLVAREHATIGEQLAVIIRDRPVTASVVKRPFYRRIE